MDFQKKVTYLYDYEENGKSIGFAKWDVRNGMLRLLVNIRYQNREKMGHIVYFLWRGGTKDTDRRNENTLRHRRTKVYGTC